MYGGKIREIGIDRKTFYSPRAKGWIMYGMDSKLKLKDQLKYFRTIKKNRRFIT